MTSLVSDQFPDLYDVNTLAEEIARDSAGRMIRGLTAAKEKSVRSLVGRAIAQGWNDETLAERVAGVVGLGDRETRAVENFRAKMLSDGLPKNVVRQRASQYAKRAKLQRARLIAQHEIAACLGQAQRILWAQQREGGTLSPYAVRVTRCHRDDRLCNVCRRQNGSRRSLKTVQGGPPFHPGCRCFEIVEDQGLLTKAADEPRDGDNDGFVYDGTPRMRPATPRVEAPALPEGPDVRAFVDAWKAMPQVYDSSGWLVPPGDDEGRLKGGYTSSSVRRIRWQHNTYVVKSTGLPLAMAELKAAEVAKALGFDHDGAALMTPEWSFSVMPFHDGDLAMRWRNEYGWDLLQDDETANMITKYEPGSWALAVLDMLIDQRDRNSGNYILNGIDQLPHPIDNEFSNIMGTDNIDMTPSKRGVKTDHIDFWFPRQDARNYAGPTRDEFLAQRDKYWPDIKAAIESASFDHVTDEEHAALRDKITVIEEYIAMIEANGFDGWAYIGSENWPREE